MKIFFQPVNLIRWNMFENVNAYKYVESFYSNKSMEIGDVIVLYIGKQVDSIESGVYGFATIISEPSKILDDADDLKNNRHFVYAMIDILSFSRPLIREQKCKELFRQFQTTHQVKEESSVNFLTDFISKIL